jgi:CBS domain-containing protein
MAGASRLLTLPRARVQERMVANVATVQASTPVREAARLMVERRVHRVYVVARGRPVGVLSALDVMQAVVQARVTTPISAFMSSPVLTVETDEPVARVTDRLGEEHVHGLVVVESGWPVGVFTQLEALASRQLEPATPVETVMSCAMLCVPVETPIFRAAGFLSATRARRVLAVSGRRLEGILTGLDLARVVAT